jgi:hypothetical protein
LAGPPCQHASLPGQAAGASEESDSETPFHRRLQLTKKSDAGDNGDCEPETGSWVIGLPLSPKGDQSVRLGRRERTRDQSQMMLRKNKLPRSGLLARSAEFTLTSTLFTRWDVRFAVGTNNTAVASSQYDSRWRYSQPKTQTASLARGRFCCGRWEKANYSSSASKWKKTPFCS